MSYLKGASGTRETPQDEPMRSDQVENSAGGFTFALDPFGRLTRWLILGSEGGTYYASESKLTTDNINTLKACIAANGLKTVEMIVEISEAGRAPHNDAAIFALAACSGLGDEATRSAANAAITRVCRTGTHLFMFTDFVEKFRGWGPSLVKGVRRWYEDKDADALAYQAVKYRQRDGVTHRDVLRRAHPRPDSAEKASVLAFISGNVEHSQGTDDKGRIVRKVSGWKPGVGTPLMIEGFLKAQQARTAQESAALVREYGLPREALLTEHLTDPEVWVAMLETGMPMTAMIRNLANMTRAGVLVPGSTGTGIVLDKLANDEVIRKARVHPLNVLQALVTYEAGRGYRGQNTWNPVAQIVDALDGAFYKAFGNVEASGKRHLIGLDVSGSMTMAMNGSFLTARAASCAMSLVTLATEPQTEVVAFTSSGWSPEGSGRRFRGGGYGGGVSAFPISPRQRLDDVIRKADGLDFGGTDCSLPMLYALDQGREVDAFVIYTDNETWAGAMHPAQALAKYREQSGINAKLIVVGITATDFSIADPDDVGMLDVVGFDTATPALIGDFAAGRV